MTANIVARHYAELTPEERFRLILAAGARGDNAEQDRLKAAGRRITLSMPDHSPYGHAFDELALFAFTELLDLAANFLETFQHSDGLVDVGDDEADDDEAGDDEVDDDEADDASLADPSRRLTHSQTIRIAGLLVLHRLMPSGTHFQDLNDITKSLLDARQKIALLGLACRLRSPYFGAHLAGIPHLALEFLTDLEDVLKTLDDSPPRTPPPTTRQGDDGEYTTADGPTQWAKLFGISVSTFKRRCEDGMIRCKKLSTKSYQVLIADLPAKHQQKFRAPSASPPK